MKAKPTTVDEYIDAFPAEIQQRLKQIRNTFKNTISGIEEKIRYGMPAFKVGKEPLYVSACKQHIGMYPIYGLENLEDELTKYRGKNTKDALHFLYNGPIPLELIEKIIKQKSLQ